MRKQSFGKTLAAQVIVKSHFAQVIVEGVVVKTEVIKIVLC